MYVCVCVCVRARARLCLCMHVCELISAPFSTAICAVVSTIISSGVKQKYILQSIAGYFKHVIGPKRHLYHKFIAYCKVKHNEMFTNFFSPYFIKYSHHLKIFQTSVVYLNEIYAMDVQPMAH
jgi:hypothetical protein